MLNEQTWSKTTIKTLQAAFLWWEFQGKEAIYMSIYSQQGTTHHSLLNCIDLCYQWRLYILDQATKGIFVPLVLYSFSVQAATERYFLHFGRQRWECHKTNSCDAMCIRWQRLIIAQKKYQLPLPRTEYMISAIWLHSALKFFLCHDAHWQCSKTAVYHSFSGCCVITVLWRFLSPSPLYKVSQVWHWQ